METVSPRRPSHHSGDFAPRWYHRLQHPAGVQPLLLAVNLCRLSQGETDSVFAAAEVRRWHFQSRTISFSTAEVHWIMQMEETERDEVRWTASDWVGRSCAAKLHMPAFKQTSAREKRWEPCRVMLGGRSAEPSHALFGFLFLVYEAVLMYFTCLCVNVQRKVSWVGAIFPLRNAQPSFTYASWTRMLMITMFPASPDTQLINITAIFTPVIPVCVQPGALLFGTVMELRSGIDRGRVTWLDAKAWWNSTIPWV